jgi:hypothetical protein
MAFNQARSDAMRRRWQDPEHRAKLSAIQNSPEYKAKQSAAKKGKPSLTKGQVFNPVCPRGHQKELTRDKSRMFCKICAALRAKAWRERDIEHSKKLVNDWRWKQNGIINEDGSPFVQQDYNRHFQIQGGMCKGCGKHQSELKQSLHADHDHKTGIFRGLLCYSCNYILGLSFDDPQILDNLRNYLKR